MNPQTTKQYSKRLSFVLRHQPEEVGVELDSAGWVSVEVLLEGMERKGWGLSLEDLEKIVATNLKKRFEFNKDGSQIRASQGHSVEVDLQYAEREPPEWLYHGTASRFLESIRESGLLKMARHQVHLSQEKTVTLEVGGRHGKPVLLQVRAGDMFQEGCLFYLSTNGVWLTECVPIRYIVFPEE